MSETPKAKPSTARKPAAKSPKATNGATAEATTDAAEAAMVAANDTAAAVEEATTAARDDVADAVESTDDAVADAADSAAETVADAANEAAVEAAAAAEAETAEAQTLATDVQDAAAAPVRTIYVTAPQPPAKKGNRVLGILIALLATGVFAALYTVAFVLLAPFLGISEPITGFLTSTTFLFPVIIVFVATAIWALIVNRAAWWAWIIGSLLIALAVYAGTIGLTALFYQQQLEWTNVLLLVSAVLAREVTVWLGGILSARGRRLKVRNAEARAQFDREEAERRAERANAS